MRVTLPVLAVLPLLTLGQACWIVEPHDWTIDIDWDVPEEDTPRFYDGSNYPGEGAFSGHRDIGEHDLALGSQLLVILADVDDEPWDQFWVEVADPSIIGVELEGMERARLSALEPGVTEVTFDADETTQDPSYTLEVREVASVRYLMSHDLTGGAEVAPSEATTEGFALRPGAVVQLGAEPLDLYGSRLSGEGLFTWSCEEGMLSVRADLETINSIEITAIGTGETTVDSGHGEPLSLRLLEEAEETELRLYEPFTAELTQIDSIDDVTGGTILGLGAFDHEGHYVIINDTDELEIAVTDGPEDLVLDWSMYPEYNGFYLETCPGEGEIELRYAGGTLTVPVLIEEGEDVPADCG